MEIIRLLVAFGIVVALVGVACGSHSRPRELHRKFNRPSDGAKSKRDKDKTIRAGDKSPPGQPIPGVSCVKTYECPSKKRFRTIDGSCNNPERPFWGATDVPFRRILSPRYGNGDTRALLDDVNLPSARLVSANIIKGATADSNSNVLTLMTMQFGQFLDHDITKTPAESVDGGCLNSNDVNCASIQVPADDDFYKDYNVNKIEFSRSTQIFQIDDDGKCLAGSFEQLNDITAFIDASNVYGSDPTVQSSLYDSATGLMRVSQIGDYSMLPTSEEMCENVKCFSAGDDRSNEQVALTTMHTIFVREHNRIATKIKQVKSHMQGQHVYQETRRIVGAIMQKIAYTEYLPAILNDAILKKYKLKPHQGSYDKDVDPRISNAFATAAYRFGHSQLQDSLSIVGGSEDSVLLSNVFFNPYHLHQTDNKVSQISRGLLQDAAQEVDELLTTQVTDHLFEGSEQFGLDLAALNIQRGRDHGLPSYGAFRTKFLPSSPLSDHLTPEQIGMLNTYYNNQPESADLFVGGLMERKIAGGQMGPLFANIIGEQFMRLKLGDSYFYKWNLKPEEQAEIEKMTLGNILCKNALQDTDVVKGNVFLLSGDGKQCSNQVDIDVNAFLTSPPPPPPPGK